MSNENKEMKMQITDKAYRFQSGKCWITLKFSKEKTAPTIESALVKIATRRIG